MLRIYLARHGQDEDNVKGILNGHRDKPLTDLGRKQAEELAGKIKQSGISFDKVYSSPLKRAFETAKIITQTLNIANPVVVANLIERNFGILTGKKHTEIDKYSPQTLKTETVNYFLNPEGAETFPMLKRRGKQILSAIKRNHKGGKILLVTHGDIGKMIYAAYYNLDWKEVLKMFHFGNSDLLLLSKDSPYSNPHIFKTHQHNL